MRPAAFLIACLVASVARAAPPVPPGLQPGDHYQLIFATSFVTAIDTDTSVPPVTPYFGGLAAADYTVTFAAWQASMLPDWNFNDIIFHAVLSTNGHDAKDRINLQSPLYNTHGELIANDANDLWDGSIAHLVNYDENADSISTDFGVWTGTTSDGVWSGGSAGNWNNPATFARIGFINSTDFSWVSASSSTASGNRRLYGVSPLLTVPGQPGDFNHDNTVDAADYVVWRKNTGSPADYDLWRTHFGQPIPASGSAVENVPVPEPSSLVLLAVLTLVLTLHIYPCRSGSA